MDIIEICKALSNETRLNILKWLKEPDKYFPPQGGSLEGEVDLKGGVCVSSIQAKAGASQSTVSNYLDILRRSGLLLCERHGKWTYYRRNEDTIKEFSRYIGKELLLHATAHFLNIIIPFSVFYHTHKCYSKCQNFSNCY